jgi:hypothetical protein
MPMPSTTRPDIDSRGVGESAFTRLSAPAASARTWLVALFARCWLRLYLLRAVRLCSHEPGRRAAVVIALNDGKRFGCIAKYSISAPLGVLSCS